MLINSCWSSHLPATRLLQHREGSSLQGWGKLLQLLLFQALISQGKSRIQEDLGFLHPLLLDCSNMPKNRASPWKPLGAEQC